MASKLEKVLETHTKVVESGHTSNSKPRYRAYVVSNLRGGVGKSTLSFNLGYELSKKNSILLADLCPQGNLTELVMRGHPIKTNIDQALRPRILGPAFGDIPDDLSYRVSETCSAFKGNKKAYFVPSTPDLFDFPSALYQQLHQAHHKGGAAVKKLLLSLKETLDAEAKALNCDLQLMDSSPFYGGGTHLAWCAADAMIIPVRVDEHSIESLGLTFRMMSDKARDFVTWNDRAGGLKAPKVAAVVMTMAGAKSQIRARPDRASCMYIERALALAEKHKDLFDGEPSDWFVITDDFMSSGRISGSERIPISELKSGQFHTVDGKRLQVNASVERYTQELKYLASIL